MSGKYMLDDAQRERINTLCHILLARRRAYKRRMTAWLAGHKGLPRDRSDMPMPRVTERYRRFQREAHDIMKSVIPQFDDSWVPILIDEYAYEHGFTFEGDKRDEQA